MKDLIEALTILLQYGDPRYPTHCEYDVLMICGIDPDVVSDEHKAKLEELGFVVDEYGEDAFVSYRYGSA